MSVDPVARGLAAAALKKSGGTITGPLAIAGGTVTVSTPLLNLTQTWNAGGVTFTGAVINVTDTASAASSLLLDLQVNGASKFRVLKDGSLQGVPAYYVGTGANGQWGASGLEVPAASTLGWSATSNATGAMDVILNRDAANTLALRNGVSAQAFNVYNTFTDASNYETGFANWTQSANVFTFGTKFAGTGVTRPVQLMVGGTNLINWATSGHMLWNTDNSFDVGASGASRPRNVFVGGYVQTGLTTIASLPAASTALNGARFMVSDSSVVASGNFGANVTGTGANVVPVFCDGTNWKIG
jgi:hypothetical protein